MADGDDAGGFFEVAGVFQEAFEIAGRAEGGVDLQRDFMAGVGEGFGEDFGGLAGAQERAGENVGEVCSAGEVDESAGGFPEFFRAFGGVGAVGVGHGAVGFGGEGVAAEVERDHEGFSLGVRVGDGVVAAGGPGVAAGDAAEGHPAAAPGAEAADGVEAVGTAGGLVAAVVTEEGAEGPAIELDDCEEEELEGAAEHNCLWDNLRAPNQTAMATLTTWMKSLKLPMSVKC